MEDVYVSKPYAHDRLMKATVLRLIPEGVAPNHITMARFVLTPLVVWLVYIGEYAWGLLAFVLTAFTDTIDGSMARTRGKITKWGIVFDPIADKLLVGSVLVVLVMRDLSVWLGMAIILVEAVVAIAGLYSHRTDMVYMANNIGKAKMCLQVAGLAVIMIGSLTGIAILHSLATIILTIALVFAIINIAAFGLRKAI